MNTIMRRLPVALTAALCVLPLMPAATQTPATVLMHACYIPALGVTYRIREAGLPSDCVGRTHVAFSWNQQGPKGDKGDRGDQGVPGDPGETGAGVQAGECPTNSFLTGYTAAGGMICRSSSWQIVEPPAPPEPPPFAPSPYDGVYAITPAITRSCTGTIASFLTPLIGNLSALEVTRISETHLQITPRIGGTLGTAVSARLGYELRVPYVEGVPGSIDFSGSMPVKEFPFVGTATFAIQGSFTSATTFTGSVSATITGSALIYSGTCTVGPGTYTATRVN
jgi:hypothetical protein